MASQVSEATKALYELSDDKSIQEVMLGMGSISLLMALLPVAANAPVTASPMLQAQSVIGLLPGTMYSSRLRVRSTGSAVAGQLLHGVLFESCTPLAQAAMGILERFAVNPDNLPKLLEAGVHHPCIHILRAMPHSNTGKYASAILVAMLRTSDDLRAAAVARAAEEQSAGASWVGLGWGRAGEGRAAQGRVRRDRMGRDGTG